MVDFSDSQNNLLLSISMDIAHVKDREDLLRLINTRLKSLFQFADVAIYALNHPLADDHVFLYDQAGILKKHPDYKPFLGINHLLGEESIAGLLGQQKPAVFDIKTAQGLKSGLPLRVLRESGISQVVCLSLNNGTKVSGIIAFYLEKPCDLATGEIQLLLAAINLIGIAVSNIICLDEIRQREEEKTILLSFSHSMALVRSKQDLAEIINEKLKKLCSIKDYVIAIIFEDSGMHGGFIYNKEAPYVTKPEFAKLFNARFELNDGVFDRVVAARNPQIYNLDEVLTKGKAPEYIKYWKSIGIDTVVGVVLMFNEKPIGVLWIQPIDPVDPMDFQNSLFQGIVAQVSVALANIMANEKVSRQLIKINDYQQRLEQENTYLLKEIETGYNHAEIIGSGEEMAAVFKQMGQVSYTNSTVLLLGETGTGKELIARAIHNNSARKEKLMVKLNCATLPVNLIESELFGHEKGSFTGAAERRIGKFELADQGTLFLDEVGELPLELQVKLLRVLQEREIERIGGKGPIKVNVRIIAATNRDLRLEVEKGNFRSDLYYRLNVFPITLPPLRNRRADIKSLALHFLARFSRSMGRNVTGISPQAMQDLLAYHWPGNVRELEHLMERSVLLSQGKTVHELQFSFGQHLAVEERGKQVNGYIKTIDENERDHIVKVLRACHGKVFGPHGAAVKLGVPVSTLNSKIAKLGIVKEKVLSVLKDARN